MRTPAELRELKAAVLDSVLGHAEMKALLGADPFRGKWPNPAKVEVHCHWDQSISIVLTEAILGQGLLGPNHLKRIISEATPSARIYGMETKRAQSQSIIRTRVTFFVPETTVLAGGDLTSVASSF